MKIRFHFAIVFTVVFFGSWAIHAADRQNADGQRPVRRPDADGFRRGQRSHLRLHLGGRSMSLLPVLNVMSHDQLRQAMTRAGFVIEHDWRPNPSAAVFLIARKPA